MSDLTLAQCVYSNKEPFDVSFHCLDPTRPKQLKKKVLQVKSCGCTVKEGSDVLALLHKISGKVVGSGKHYMFLIPTELKKENFPCHKSLVLRVFRDMTFRHKVLLQYVDGEKSNIGLPCMVSVVVESSGDVNVDEPEDYMDKLANRKVWGTVL